LFRPSCKISPPSVQRVVPVGRKKTQNRPRSNLNTGTYCTAHNAAGNEWDHGISAEVKEGPADCIRIGEVIAVLKNVKRHKLQICQG